VIEIDTRLRAAGGVAKTETDGAVLAFEKLKRRGHPDGPPPLASDGWGGHRDSLLEVWGQVPAYGGRGRPPTTKRPGEEWQYLQMVKQRDHGRVTGIEVRVIYGDPTTVPEVVGANTAYIERTHLTMRQDNGRLGRKTLGFSKDLAMLRAACTWEDLVYNLTHPVKTLRQEVNQGRRRWQPRTPMMAAGLTDHVWTVEQILMALPLPATINT
jgi:hypothetical protein